MVTVHTKNFSKKIVATLLAGVFMLTAGMSTPAFAAADTSALDQKKSALQQQIGAANAELEKLAGVKKDSEAYLTALTAKMRLVQTEVNTIETYIKEVQGKISTLQKKITDTEAQIVEMTAKIAEQEKLFQVQFDNYQKRQRAVYVSGGVTTLEAMLTCSDFSQLLTRAEMVKSISKKDEKMLNELKSTMSEIKDKKTSMEVEKVKLESNKTELLTSKSKFDDSLIEVQGRKNALLADKNESVRAMNALQGQSKAQQKVIDMSSDEQAQVDRDIADAIHAYEESQKKPEVPPTSGGDTGGGGNTESGDGLYTGTFTHPCPNYNYISVSYPNYSDGRYHGGIDFACGTRTPDIYAADGGTVITATDLGDRSYGKYIAIRHKEGLYTLYGHASALYVTAGQKVTKGKRIASVGTTGNSTGNHLHFEVRLGDGSTNRVSADPRDYIPNI